jgi:hypothetical protein
MLVFYQIYNARGDTISPAGTSEIRLDVGDRGVRNLN